MKRRPAPRLQRIELRDCSVRLGRHWALREVSFDLRAGERWLLTGPNGAGKTVLLKLLRGDLWPTPTGRERRRYHWRDGEVDDQPLDAAPRIAYLGPERQDRYERRESTLTVAQVVLTGFDESDFPLQPATRSQLSRIDATLQAVGLRGLAQRRLLTLSYGQRRRVLLARAVVRDPEVLLLDEAMNGLDASGRRSFLRALRHALPATAAWILASHRQADAREVHCTHVASIVDGRLESAGLALRGGKIAASAVRRPRPRRSSRTLRPEAAASKLFEIRHAAVYREGRCVTAPFDWTLRAGESWRLRGPNGSGKSTLVAMIYGDLWPRHGAVHWRRWTAVEHWKRRIGLVSPELQARYAATESTVAEIVVSGLHDSIGLNLAPTAAETRRGRALLRAWGLEPLASRRARELSYGQLRLTLHARAHARARRLYLFDEPYDGLDAAARGLAAARLAQAVARGAALVIATHHDEDVPGGIDGELVLRRGRTPVQKLPLAPPPPNRPPPPS